MIEKQIIRLSLLKAKKWIFINFLNIKFKMSIYMPNR